MSLLSCLEGELIVGAGVRGVGEAGKVSNRSSGGVVGEKEVVTSSGEQRRGGRSVCGREGR